MASHSVILSKSLIFRCTCALFCWTRFRHIQKNEKTLHLLLRLQYEAHRVQAMFIQAYKPVCS